MRGLLRFLRDSLLSILHLIRTGAPMNIWIPLLRASFMRQGQLKKTYGSQISRYDAMRSELSLSNDWFGDNIVFWCAVFDEFSLWKKEIEVLEIGSWEGLSGSFILNSLVRAHLTCVDTWEGADEHKNLAAAPLSVLGQIERRFDENLARFSDRLTKFKGTSFSFYNKNDSSKKYDLIYVDGSHHSDDVMIDAIKCFEALKVGGVMIFDDFLWRYYKNPMSNPAGAINAFLKINKGNYRIVFVYYQIAIEKISEPQRDHDENITFITRATLPTAPQS
jgi:predicted O-methyltransferase YrrM